ncbi:MAG: DUF2083 domain-containing protein, partial [Litoreibacter sp.]|nr:DUF2083 domain-containing protein [Litoreibacter sp.]
DFDVPPVNTASMLLVGDMGDAGARAAQTAPAGLAVGASCRVCPRPHCPARREPSILPTG